MTSTSAPTTTTLTPTTTTLAATTTTESAPTTTILQGNWAEVPIVVTWGGMVLGWWDGSEWVSVKTDTILPIEGGEDYQVAVPGIDDAIISGGQQ